MNELLRHDHRPFLRPMQDEPEFPVRCQRLTVYIAQAGQK